MEPVATPRKARALLLGVGAVCVFAVALFFTLKDLSFYDTLYWAQAGMIAAEGNVVDETHVTFGYPGVTVVPLMGVLVAAGMDPTAALHLVVGTWMALLLSLCVVLAYLLRPHSLWWVGVLLWGAVSIPGMLFLRATPPSPIVALLTVVAVLMVLYVYERCSTSLIWWGSLGAVLGLALLTRYDAGAILALTTLPFLVWVNFRYAVGAAAVAGAVSLGLNTFLWSQPLVYIEQVYEKVLRHYSAMESHAPIWMLMQMSPFSFMSAGLGCVAWIRRWLPIPLAVFGWIVGMSAVFTVLMYSSTYHPPWYFLPVLAVWEVLLPLWVLEGAKRWGVSEEWTMLVFSTVFVLVAFATIQQ